TASRSSSIPEENTNFSGGDVQSDTEEQEDLVTESGESHRIFPGIDLSVVLSATTGSSRQSEIRVLMDDQALQDVEGLIASRDDPIGKVLEVEKL
ncbi:hypothetical protein A2U01_0077044, partial [Trifolium medium]|nr:hypothetical protein [Trifolium medium]